MTTALPEITVEAVEARAAGSSFYAAMRLMPKAERRAMFAIYAFCRVVDDIADADERPAPIRRAELADWARDVRAYFAGGRPQRLAFLAEAIERFGLREQDFLDVIDGMLMDVDSTIVAPPRAELDRYIDRVACAVGRLSVCTFGMHRDTGIEVARHLGTALQLTNIIRDLDEDAAIGRLYLPEDSLAAAGIASRDPLQAIADPAIDQCCRSLAQDALAHFDLARAIMRERPSGRQRTPRLMAEVYAHLLEKMLAAGWAPPRTRARIGKPRLVWLILRHGLVG